MQTYFKAIRLRLFWYGFYTKPAICDTYTNVYDSVYSMNGIKHNRLPATTWMIGTISI